MIIRKDGTGLILIGQTDHSRFVGQLAAHWGNRDFESPKPFDSVVRAATYHDYGWLRYETSPLISPESGEPYPFLKAPMTPQQLGSYQWALDWMADIDPYSGLIVNMHRTGLWKARYDTIKHPAGRYNLTTLSPEVQAFVAKNEAWQTKQRATLDAKGVWTNYRLMQLWDLLGLYFGCQDPYDDYVEPVPTSYRGADDEGVKLTMKALSPRKVLFDPFPFDVRPCRAQLTFKRVPQTTFEDVEAFRRAWFGADVEIMNFELV
jgi:hypothetical protein